MSIAEFPRKAIKEQDYFFRGLSTPREQLLRAMDTLGDVFVPAAFEPRSRTIAAEELACLNEIDEWDQDDRTKCELILALVHREQSLNEIRKALEKKSSEEKVN